MREVVVLGMGQSKFGKFPEKTVPELGRDVAEIALHLRGHAGKRQMFNAKVRLAQMQGSGAVGLESGPICDVHILVK